MNLAILCPSRGRPRMAKKMQDSFPCDVFFYLDDDDPDLERYDVQHKTVGPSTQITYAYNLLWQQNPGYDAYGLLGDDGVCCTPTILESLGIRSLAFRDGIWVAGTADGRGVDSFPHPIVSARWADILGYVIPPIFLHWYGDSRTTSLAKALGRFIDLSPTVLIDHQTPKTGKNPVDATYKRIRRGSRHARDTFVASFERYFDADLMTLKRAIDDEVSLRNDLPGRRELRPEVP